MLPPSFQSAHHLGLSLMRLPPLLLEDYNKALNSKDFPKLIALVSSIVVKNMFMSIIFYAYISNIARSFNS